MTPARPRVHDLLRVGSACCLRDAAGGDRPGWFDPSPTAPVWVVVRRVPVEDGLVGVGIRGTSRSERWAAVVPAGAIAERVPPTSVPHCRRRDLPALVALEAMAPIADAVWPGGWGPVGGVGYELVAGDPVVSEASDLDLVLYADTPLDRAATADVLDRLRRRAGTVRIDLIIETAAGGFAAGDWLADRPSGVALRTPRSPVLTTDPWAAR